MIYEEPVAERSTSAAGMWPSCICQRKESVSNTHFPKSEKFFESRFAFNIEGRVILSQAHDNEYL